MSIPNFHPVPVRYDAPRALYADFVTRSLAANFNDETKMAALGGIAGSENRLMIIQKHYLPKQKNTFMYSVHLPGT